MPGVKIPERERQRYLWNVRDNLDPGEGNACTTAWINYVHNPRAEGIGLTQYVRGILFVCLRMDVLGCECGPGTKSALEQPAEKPCFLALLLVLMMLCYVVFQGVWVLPDEHAASSRRRGYRDTVKPRELISLVVYFLGCS